ncbi:MAG: hypothetical protein ACLTBV_18475 [Enterocloster bolteae]
MIKGIISHDFEGSLEEIRISESNAVFVIAAKQTEESLIGTEYCIQNISLADRMSRRDAVTILARSVKDMLIKLHGEQPKGLVRPREIHGKPSGMGRTHTCWNILMRLWPGRRVSMEDKYHHLWLLFQGRMARRAGEAASTEKKEMYDWVLEETALIEAEVFLEE